MPSRFKVQSAPVALNRDGPGDHNDDGNDQ
jgi:hypothetical protein